MKCMCISNKLIVNSMKGICCQIIILILLSKIQISTSSLSTTSTASLSANFNNSYELTCVGIKELLVQRGINERDIPKFPIKGEYQKFFLHIFFSHVNIVSA